MTKGPRSHSREPTGLRSVEGVVRLLLTKDLPSHHVICSSLLNSLHLVAIKMATKTKNFAALGPESQVSLPLFAGARKLGFFK